MSAAPWLSIVIATRNRVEILRETITQVRNAGLPPDRLQWLIVDNGSEDGTADWLRSQRDLGVIALATNRGACAKALALPRVEAPLVLFLDDDARPRPGVLPALCDRLSARARLGAAGCRAFLPDGTEECAALPRVFMGCGVGFRTEALRAVGGLDASLFMAAEEYDLAFRLRQAGWEVEVCADLAVDHLKTPGARSSATLMYYDLRNNLRLCARYLPPAAARCYQEDWLARYRWLAELNGATDAATRAAADAAAEEWTQRGKYRDWRLTPEVFEGFFVWEATSRRFRELRADGVRRVGLIDLGKNILAFHRGAARAGVELALIGDDRFCQATPAEYRGVPIVPLDAALSASHSGDVDALVIANCAVAHARRRWESLRGRTQRPVHGWYVDWPSAEAAAATVSAPAPTSLSGQAPAKGALGRPVALGAPP